MKAETAKWLNGVRSRVKDLKSSFLLELKGRGSDGSLVPRVSGIVIREGLRAVDVARRLAKKHNVKLETEKAKALDDAQLFFEDLKESHGDEYTSGGFIYRVESEFITHLDIASALAVSIDTEAEAAKAKAELEVEFDAEIDPVEVGV